MKNKFTKVIGLLNVPITFFLLSSCENSGMNKIQYPGKQSNQGVMHAKHDPSQKGDKENSTLEDRGICPSCKEGARFLYKLSDINATVVLLCEECNALWLDPNNISRGQVSSDESLRKKFNVEDPEVLFDESSWATKEEVNRSTWKELAKKNTALLK